MNRTLIMSCLLVALLAFSCTDRLDKSLTGEECLKVARNLGWEARSARMSARTAEANRKRKLSRRYWERGLRLLEKRDKRLRAKERARAKFLASKKKVAKESKTFEIDKHLTAMECFKAAQALYRESDSDYRLGKESEHRKKEKMAAKYLERYKYLRDKKDEETEVEPVPAKPLDDQSEAEHVENLYKESETFEVDKELTAEECYEAAQALYWESESDYRLGKQSEHEKKERMAAKYLERYKYLRAKEDEETEVEPIPPKPIDDY